MVLGQFELGFKLIAPTIFCQTPPLTEKFNLRPKAAKNTPEILFLSSELWRLDLFGFTVHTTFMLIARTNRYKLVIHALVWKPLVITIRPKFYLAGQRPAGDLYIDKHDPGIHYGNVRQRCFVWKQFSSAFKMIFCKRKQNDNQNQKMHQNKLTAFLKVFIKHCLLDFSISGPIILCFIVVCKGI